jgi:hypothetical protein
MTREGHAMTAARPAHGRNHADQLRSGMDAGEPSTEARRPKVEVHRSMAIPTRFKSRGASQESVTGPDSRGDRVARLISDMYTTAAELKTDAGPRMAKLGIKLNLPEPYDGSANIDQFENWLAQLVAWLQMYDLDGREEQIDLMRVQLLCQTLKGRALTFYQAQLEEAREQGEYRSFNGMIIALKNRFLHRATALEAAQRFENVTQGSKDTQALMEELRKYAARMVEAPSQYTMKRRFMYALRKDISAWVISVGHNPETSTMEELMEAARNFEESQWYQRGFQNAREGNHPRPTPVDHKGKVPVRQSSQRPVQSRAALQPTKLQRPHTRPTTTEPQAGPSGSKLQVTRSKTPHAGDKPKEKAPTGSTAQIICYTCNKKGHFSNQCPEKTGVQGYAMEMEAEGAEVPQEQQENLLEEDRPDEGSANEESSPEGVQYDPEDHHECYSWDKESENSQVDLGGIHVVPISELEEQREDRLPQIMAAHMPPQSSTIRRKVGFIAPQPERDVKQQTTITVLLNVGNIKATVLLDTGCTTNAVSPDFAKVAGLKPLELTQQMGLALAVKGSSSKLNYGTWADVSIGPLMKINTYFDIINIDRYDVILGTPFLWTHGISPIFEDGGYIQYKGKRLDIPVLSKNRPVNQGLTQKEKTQQFFRAKETPGPSKTRN